MFSRVLAVLLTVLSLVLAPAAATAADRPAMLNKDGLWEMVVRDDTCMTAMHIEGGAQLGFFASAGEVSFVAFPAGKPPKGKAGVLVTDADSFAFTPVVDKSSVAMDDVINADAVAALRKAKELRVVVDGKLAVGARLEGTGFPEALDGVIACSKGEKGWWGEGAKVAEQAAPWAVRVGDDRYCSSMAQDDAGSVFILSAGQGGILVSVAAKGRRGRKGQLQIDDAAFDFTPDYSRPDFFTTGFLGEDHLRRLAQAKDLWVVIDGRQVLSLHVENSGLDSALARLQACVPKPAGKRG